MHGVGIGGGMDRDGGDAEFLAGAQHPQRDLAGLAMRILPKSGCWRSFDDHQRLAIFNRLAILDDDRPPCRNAAPGSGHRLHCLDDEERLAFAHCLADIDIGPAAGFGRADRWCRPSARGVAGGRRRRHLRRWACRGCGRGRGDSGRRPGRPKRRRARATRMRVPSWSISISVRVGFVEEVRELANEILIDDLLLVVISGFFHPCPCRRGPPSPRGRGGSRPGQDHKSRRRRPARS